VLSRSPGGDERLSGAGVALVLAALAAGAWWRLADVGPALLFGDELHSIRELPRGYAALFTTFGATGSGIALPLLQRALSDLFGLGHWALRLPAYLPSLALLFSMYPLSRTIVGAGGAAVATILVAVNPQLIFYAHFGRAYALVACLAFILLVLLQRAVRRGEAGGATLLLGAALTAALPYVHLTALAFVIPIYAGAVVALVARGKARSAWGLAGSLAAGCVATALLHLPARDSIRPFVEAKLGQEYYGSFGLLDVAALLVGHRVLATVMLTVLTVLLAAIVLRERVGRLPLVLACVSPAIALCVVRPTGDAYAYARYLIVCVPAVCLLFGWGIAVLAARWTAAAGGALALVLLAAGPYGFRHTAGGPHANSYIDMFPLPAFDVPWPETPAFYEELATEAEPVRILEIPELENRSRHLYRNYYLTHRKPTDLGLAWAEPGSVPVGPYVALSHAAWLEQVRADYIVLHLDPADEVARYWTFVYGLDQAGEPAVAAYMERHRVYAAPAAPPIHVARELETRLGPPVYDDGTIAVWRAGRLAPS
jgi:hypothetical protein